MKKQEHASPELGKFFDRLADLKKYVKQRYEETKDEEIGNIYEKLHEIFKTKEEEENE